MFYIKGKVYAVYISSHTSEKYETTFDVYIECQTINDLNQFKLLEDYRDLEKFVMYILQEENEYVRNLEANSVNSEADKFCHLRTPSAFEIDTDFFEDEFFVVSEKDAFLFYAEDFLQKIM